MPEPALQAEESLMELAEGQETKRCAACRIVKPVSEYYKDRTHSRGIKTRCKQCLRLCKEAFKNQQRAKSAAEQVCQTPCRVFRRSIGTLLGICLPFSKISSDAPGFAATKVMAIKIDAFLDFGGLDRPRCPSKR